MKAAYIFRLDDIAPNMNWENYFRLKTIFAQYQVKPIIGVIPDNQDEELKKWPSYPADFWEEIREVQSRGWEIAIHGCQHRFETDCSGLLGIHCKSEFAGLPFERQYAKLAKAKDIFARQGINSTTFMAPAHTFDRETLRALRLAGIYTITDGYGFYPYTFDQILFVPQMFATPRPMPFGVFTFCLHSNEMSQWQIKHVETFISQNHKQIISFPMAANYASNKQLHRWMRWGAGAAVRFARKLRA